VEGRQATGWYELVKDGFKREKHGKTAFSFLRSFQGKMTRQVIRRIN